MVTPLLEDELETASFVSRELGELASFVSYELDEATRFVLKGSGVKRENSKGFCVVEEMHVCASTQ